MKTNFLRAFPLDDISIRSGGDGRTVVAYAAVFNIERAMSDQQGSGYLESLDPNSFDRTIGQRGTNFQVLFNHGMDLYMQPAAEFTKPLGVPLEVKADKKGVMTVTRYSKTPLADEILELVKDGAIRGQSFSGRWIRSTPDARVFRSGERVRRLEVAMLEYGPTPFPAYEEASVTGVRSAAMLAEQITGLDPEERAELVRLLQTGTVLDPAGNPGTTETDPKDPEPTGTTPKEPEPEPDEEDLQAKLQALLAKAGLLK